MEVYFGNLTKERGHVDEMAEKVESLVKDAEELVQSANGELPPKERRQLEEMLGRLKASAAQFRLQAMKGIRATDQVIRKHPYESAGVALAAGLVIGLLAGRPCCKES